MGHRMLALIGAEARKLVTVRSTFVLAGLGELLVVGGTAGLLSRRTGTADATLPPGAVAHVGLVALFSLVVGILMAAGEFRHRTAGDTFLTTPRRWPVVAAKLHVAAAFAVLFAVVGTALSMATTAIWLGGFDAGTGELWRTVAGGLAWNVLYALIGVGIGFAVRNVVGAIAGALAWIAVVEGIVASVVGAGLSRWLPFAAGLALGRVDRHADGQLSQGGAAVLLVGYTLVIVAVSVVVTGRRDIDA